MRSPTPINASLRPSPCDNGSRRIAARGLRGAANSRSGVNPSALEGILGLAQVPMVRLQQAIARRRI